MTAPNPQLLRSLGKLARGLSALFWGLPAALLIGAETARADWLKPLGFLPALAVNALLVYGLWQMGDFQRQERPWRHALDRAQLLARLTQIKTLPTGGDGCGSCTSAATTMAKNSSPTSSQRLNAVNWRVS